VSASSLRWLSLELLLLALSLEQLLPRLGTGRRRCCSIQLQHLPVVGSYAAAAGGSKSGDLPSKLLGLLEKEGCCCSRDFGSHFRQRRANCQGGWGRCCWVLGVRQHEARAAAS
jgi:hypothetical protein